MRSRGMPAAIIVLDHRAEEQPVRHRPRDVADEDAGAGAALGELAERRGADGVAERREHALPRVWRASAKRACGSRSAVAPAGTRTGICPRPNRIPTSRLAKPFLHCSGGAGLPYRVPRRSGRPATFNSPFGGKVRRRRGKEAKPARFRISRHAAPDPAPTKRRNQGSDPARLAGDRRQGGARRAGPSRPVVARNRPARPAAPKTARSRRERGVAAPPGRQALRAL